MKNLLSIITMILAPFASFAQGTASLTLDDIYIRDPFILPIEKNHTYYMYASSTTTDRNGEQVGGVKVYKSTDLKKWSEPKQVCVIPEGNWSRGVVWAPEVHEYKGKFYLFATINSDITWKAPKQDWVQYTWRATQIFRADDPEGPFMPLSIEPSTPADQMALDGTLWVEDGKPYMIYCHEWVELTDGAMNVVEMTPDLSARAAQPQKLFHASAAPWSTGLDYPQGDRYYVTDGCFLYRTKSGKLLMIWSSFYNGQYAVGVAESVTGRVKGPWRQQPEPIFKSHGGHAMIFKTFDGRLCLTLHQPNSPDGEERAKIFEIEDLGTTLRIKEPTTTLSK